MKLTQESLGVDRICKNIGYLLYGYGSVRLLVDAFGHHPVGPSTNEMCQLVEAVYYER